MLVERLCIVFSLERREGGTSYIELHIFYKISSIINFQKNQYYTVTSVNRGDHRRPHFA